MIIIKTNIEAKRGENALKWEEKEIDLDIDMLEFIDCMAWRMESICINMKCLWIGFLNFWMGI